MIIRGLAGILIGVAYGALVGAVMSQLTGIGLDRAHPGPLIPNAVEFARIVTVSAGLFAGVCGAFIGLVVSLSGTGKAKAASIGFFGGLLVLGLLSLTSSSLRDLAPASVRDWIGLLVALLILPCGLALMSVVVAAVTARLKSYGP